MFFGVFATEWQKEWQANDSTLAVNSDAAPIGAMPCCRLGSYPPTDRSPSSPISDPFPRLILPTRIPLVAHPALAHPARGLFHPWPISSLAHIKRNAVDFHLRWSRLQEMRCAEARFEAAEGRNQPHISSSEPNRAQAATTYLTISATRIPKRPHISRFQPALGAERAARGAE